MINREELDYLIDYLLTENEVYKDVLKNPDRFNRKKDMFRTLCNFRLPKEIDPEFLVRYDKFMDELIAEKDIIDVQNIKTLKELYPRNKYKNADKIAILKADITSIKIDAIVNSANPKMEGCYIPLHKDCVNNSIHFYAGIELKNECKRYLGELGKNFIVKGKGIVTDAFHLPCKKIIHMVVNESNGFPKEEDYAFLINTYKKALRKLVRKNLRTIAYCSLGTGAYKFPKKETLTRVLKMVDEFLDENRENIDKVVLVEYTLENFKILENIVLENENILKNEKNIMPKTSKITSKTEKEKLLKLDLENKLKTKENRVGRNIIEEMTKRLEGENNEFVNQDYIRKVDRPKYEKIIYTLLPEEEIIYDDYSFLEEIRKNRRKKKPNLHK